MNGAQNDNQQGAFQDSPINEASGVSQPGGGAPGYAAAIEPVANRKSPALATWLSCMPGLGQIYVGYYQQGFMDIFVVAGTIAILNSSLTRGAEPFFGIFLAFFWIFQMIDANRRAVHYNRVMAGLGGEEVPDGFEMPTTKGSLMGGAVLIVIGILFILDLNFGISLEWIEDWWPLILVLVGANLIYKARKNAD